MQLLESRMLKLQGHTKINIYKQKTMVLSWGSDSALRVLAVPVGDPDSVLSTHIVNENIPGSTSRRPDTIF